MVGAVPGALQGKVVIVTGSSRGIGKAIAVEFAREGANVVVCGRSTGEGPLTIESTVGEIIEAGGDAIAVPCDVSIEAHVERLVELTMARWGRIDVLINNAGFKGVGSLDETSFATWQAMFRTNVDGVYLCSMAVLPHMREQRAGSIVTISSSRAQSDDAGATAYAASKAAADRFTIKLAAETRGQGIAANVLYPGSTATERSIAAGNDPPGRQRTEEKQIIPACLFLAGQTDEGITGASPRPGRLRNELAVGRVHVHESTTRPTRSPSTADLTGRGCPQDLEKADVSGALKVALEMLGQPGADHCPRVIGALLGVPKHHQAVLAFGGVTEADGAPETRLGFYRRDQIVRQLHHLGLTAGAVAETNESNVHRNPLRLCLCLIRLPGSRPLAPTA